MSDNSNIKTYYYGLAFMVFEACVFSIHYYLMGKKLHNSPLDIGVDNNTLLQIAWGLGGSLVPIILFFFALYFYKKSKNDTDSGGIFGFIIVLLLIAGFIAMEVGIFYGAFKSPMGLWDTSNNFDYSALAPALGFSGMHLVITFVLVLFVFKKYSKDITAMVREAFTE